MLPCDGGLDTYETICLLNTAEYTFGKVFYREQPPTPLGMYQHPPLCNCGDYMFRNTVTTAGVCVGAGCVSWLCVSQEWYVLYGVSVLRGYVL
jgi:hypothetical protein